MKFILLINVKIPTIVDILTFMSMINTIYESFKERIILNLGGIRGKQIFFLKVSIESREE